MTAGTPRPPVQAQLASAWADFSQGRVKEAEAALRRLAAAEPCLGTPLHLLAAMRWQRDAATAEMWLRRVLTLDPHNAAALTALAATLKAAGRAAEGSRWLRMAVSLQPADPGSLGNLGGMPAESSLRWCRRALCIDPYNVGLLLERYSLLLIQGDAERAAADLEAVDQVVDPRIQAARICTAFLLEDGPAAALALARQFNERFARPLQPLRRYRLSSAVERKLRIGYIGGDGFRHHTAAFTLIPTIEGHDRNTVEVFCYSDVPEARRDSITERFVAASTRFRDVSGLPDEAVAEAIVEDQIEVIIDSFGYPQRSRVLALARRPAPLQIHWPLMGSLGLDAVDVVLGDRWITPEGAESWFSEALVRLPFAFAYDQLRPLPDLGPAPSRDVVFGSFNQLAKLSRRTVRLWSRILQAVPRSRLLLKTPGLADAEARSRVQALFSAEGADTDRIELRPPTRGFEEHMASYADIDIALDPTPYGGVITTLEAMWMGVPVVTLAGDRVLGRYGHAFVSVLGLSQLSAADEDDYVAKAVDLAEDGTGRAVLRTSLRERMRASPICDGRAMAASIESAIRGMAKG